MLGRRLRCLHTNANVDTQGLASLIRQCGNFGSLDKARKLHAHLDADALYRWDRFLHNLLIQTYAKCGSIADAKRTFDSIRDKNMFSWTLLIVAYAQHGYGGEVLELYHSMNLEGIELDGVTLVSVLGGCANAGAAALDEGRRLHSRAKQCGFMSDFLGSALINMYGKCHSSGEAKRVFDEMPTLNVYCWNAMLSAYAQNGHYMEATALYGEMLREGVMADGITYITMLTVCSFTENLEEGRRVHSALMRRGLKPYGVLGNALLTMYCKCQRIDLAEKVFDSMIEKQDASWNVVISGYAHSGQCIKALKLFKRMTNEGVKPDRITLMSVLDACCLLGNLSEGRRIHELFGDIDSVVVRTALVNMYGKCGSVDDARAVFDSMSEKNVVTWTAMISAYAQNEHCIEALEMFKKMDELHIELDNVALVCVIDACSRLKDLKEGKELHHRIKLCMLNSDVTVCNALVSMYNKCGSILQAKSVFDQVQNKNVVTWNAMIAAFSEHGLDNEAVELFGEMLVSGFAPDELTFVSILFSCSHAGLFEKGLEHFAAMIKDFGLGSNLCREHYLCMADLLGRSGRLREAEEFLENMPFEADRGAWTTLLSACCTQRNVPLGESIAEKIFRIAPRYPGPYALLSNMYASVGRFADAERIRNLMKQNCG